MGTMHNIENHRENLSEFEQDVKNLLESLKKYAMQWSVFRGSSDSVDEGKLAKRDGAITEQAKEDFYNELKKMTEKYQKNPKMLERMRQSLYDFSCDKKGTNIWYPEQEIIFRKEIAERLGFKPKESPREPGIKSLAQVLREGRKPR